MSQKTYEKTILQPRIPEHVFPVAMTVFSGDDSPPPPNDADCMNGDIYMDHMVLYMFCDLQWVKWSPETILRLDLEGDILYVAPCATHGVQLIDSVDDHTKCLKETRQYLNLRNDEPLTSSHIINMINKVLKRDSGTPAKIKSSEIKESTSAGHSAMKTCGPSLADSDKSMKKRKYHKESRVAVASGSSIAKGKGKKNDKGKGKGKMSERAQSKDSEEHLQAPSEPKRRKTTPEVEEAQHSIPSLLDQIVCPPDTPVIEWKQLYVQTYLPWFSMADRKMVEYMAKAVPALDSPRLVVELYYNGHSSSVMRMIPEIESALARGHTILVRGWESNPSINFSEEEIGLYRPTLTQPVVVQDAIKRAKQQLKKIPDFNDVYRTVTLAEFIDLADDPSECLNLLDLPNVQPDVPLFVRPFSDNINARSMTMNDCYLPKTGMNKEKNFYGVQTTLGDSERLRGWDLMTHGGFLTYPHHDAAGLCTYITVRSGSKVWAYIDPSVRSKEGEREELFDAWDDIVTFNSPEGLDKYQTAVVLLEPGDTLIQPPGSMHMVYTPQDGLTSGGHFLSYSTMHLTELSLFYDCSIFPDDEIERGQSATNAVHPSILRYITWMILALPKYASENTKKFYRRPLIALIAFMDNPQNYTSKDIISHMPSVKEGSRDTMAQEMDAEIAAARIIVNQLKKGLGVTDAAKMLNEGGCMGPGPECDLGNIFK